MRLIASFRPMALLLVILFLATACSDDNGAAGGIVTSIGAESMTATSAPPATAPTGVPADLDLYDVSELVDVVSAGVVSVTSSQVRLGFEGVPQEVPAGAGTGIVLGGDGLVLTNYHVIAQAESLSVIGRDGRTRPAEVVSTSPSRDLALLRVDDGAGLGVLPLGTMEEVEVGDPAIAIGNALGLDVTQPTVSVGIVSAIGRTIRTPTGLLQDLIQTDAAINPGNSGGPLLDGEGRLIGVNTAVAGGQAQNVGFAIAVDTVRRFVDRFERGVGEPFLGIAVVSNSARAANQLGLDVETGALVAEVDTGGPAAEAGLRRWDVIVGYQGQEISSAADLTEAVFETSPGDEVSLEIVRDGDRQGVTVSIGERDLGR